MGDVEITPTLRRAWREQAPSITDAEIRALLPITQGGGSWVARVLRAYRAGIAVHDPAERPLSGFGSTCPTCESVHVAAILWQRRPGRVTTGSNGELRFPGESVMWVRCFDDGTVYRPATGEVWPNDPTNLIPADDPEGNPDRG